MSTDSVECPLPEERLRYWEERRTYFPNPRAVLLPLLHDLQEHCGHVSRDAMRWAADFVGVTPVEVFGVASFYWMYDFEPRARKRIAVCHNISCDLRGKDAIVQAICEELGIPDDERPGHGKAWKSADGEWSVQTVECMGSCTTAPMMDVNGRYFEELTPETVRSILQLIKDGKEALPQEPADLPPALGDKLAHSYDANAKGNA